ncbi:MAG: DUF5908 family protein [Candidatus Accumulibacter propinquus]|jgi:hypothetical protein
MESDCYMPIEIKELHVSVALSTPPERSASTLPGAAAQAGGDRGADREAIVAECVEQVLQILQNKSER